MLLFGCSYKTAPISLRERFYNVLLEAEKKQSLPSLFGCSEYSVIATCNRCELVLVTNEKENTTGLIESFIKENGFQNGMFYVKYGKDAVRHMLSVSCGLDSESLYEEEIRYQVRKAGISSRREGKSKGVLSFLFDFCYNASGRIRKNYRIKGESLAGTVVKKILKKTRPRNILLIGSGKTIASAVRELNSGKIYVYTRRKDLPEYLEKAERVSEDEFDRILGKCDLVISATASDSYAIRKEQVRRKDVTIIDFGFPRNVDPEISSSGIRIINIDDMARYVRARKENTEKVVNEVNLEADTFYRTLYYSKLNQTIPSLYRWAESIRLLEMEEAISKIRSGASVASVLDSFSKSIVSKLLHPVSRFSRQSELNLKLISGIFGDELNGKD